MNKIEYLNALKEALKDTDDSVMEEILSDYEEHFQVGIEKGKSEEQICEELGTIDDLVEEIKGVYNTDNQEGKYKNSQQSDSKSKKFKDWHFNFNNIDSEKIGGVINNALDSAGETISKIDVIEIGHTLKSTLDQATSSINNFADSYIKNQGDGQSVNKRNAEGFKENVTKSYDDAEEPIESTQTETENKKETEIKEDIEYDDSTIDWSESEESNDEPVDSDDKSDTVNSNKANTGLNVIIDGICANVTVRKSSNNKINLSYENNGNDRQKQMYEFYSYKEGNTVYAGIRRVGKSVFLFNLILNSININVEVPEGMGNIHIKTASGNVQIVDVNSDRMIAATASGDILIDKVYATDIQIRSSSGEIKLDDLNCIQLNTRTESGDVEADNIETKFLSLKSSSGDIKCRNIVADIIDNRSFSGDFNYVNVKVSEGKIRSTSGNISISEFTMNNSDVSNVSGNIKLSQIVGDGLRAGSTSGNITLDVNVKRCHASSKSGYVKVKCQGDIILESNSISGNINVNLKNNGNGYCVNSRTTSGGLYINYNNMCQRNLKTGTYTNGNQGSELILSSVSGDIHLNDY
ncbi:DUF4097 family beta strand repeat-containing protein [Anaeromicropila populeti]|uniref:Putative adhesin n=1 Tax=Anaeromicropila populeti TaxID=37658 RepID=A0A1I6INF5_9FIRM|nr:DUF4097 family beta strand repeat-containing protein [Anaeromicropila populeti]SFR68258.1 Putative adhesin [Anaeromicropila populeti]